MIDAAASNTENVGLIDVSDIPLNELFALTGDTGLAYALRRVTEAAAGQPDTDVSAFESSI
ncbi:MAG: FxSxx-COOH cyclophane-containing RiPP peptide [Pseudonocardiaceae bacterium]